MYDKLHNKDIVEDINNINENNRIEDNINDEDI